MGTNGLSAEEALAAARKYTAETVIGGGALKGKNCTIKSITEITGGHRVTFEWTLDDGTVQTNTMDVMNGVAGTYDFVEKSFTKVTGTTINAYAEVITGLSSSWFRSDPIAVKRGQVIEWYASGYDQQTAMISTCNADGSNIIVKDISYIDEPWGSSTHHSIHNYYYTVEEDGYIMVCHVHYGTSSKQPKLMISEPSAFEKSSIFAIDEATDETTNRNLSHAFKRVSVIGDSYTEGYMSYSNTSGTLAVHKEYSWVAHMNNLTGSEWINRGVTGATTKAWLESANGLAKVVADGEVQAYIIGLAINDSKITSGQRAIPVGDTTDIGTEAATYYGYLSKIITEIAAVSPSAKIFVNTCPWDIVSHDPANADRLTPYNEAIKNIVDYYKNTYSIYCLDLAGTYARFFAPGVFQRFQKSAHPTVEGHARIARIMEYIVSDYMYNHVDDFVDIPWLDMDNLDSFIKKSELKSVVAASSDFADFQTRMAAL